MKPNYETQQPTQTYHLAHHPAVGRRIGELLYHRFGERLVSGAGKAGAQSAGVGIRSGLDDAVSFDGLCVVSCLEGRERKKQTPGLLGFWHSNGFKRAMVNHLFRPAQPGWCID